VAPKVENLSPDASADFADIWYDIAPDDHFWVWWRFKHLLWEIRAIDLDTALPMRGLDIGCGHGAVQRQLAANTRWIADGCDLNRLALEKNAGHPARVLYYDVHDRRPELREYYDFLVMFDVLEHIPDAASFVQSAAYHLKPGGFVFVNVPAMQSLYSKYDAIQGHCRRYDKPTLHEHLAAGPFTVHSMRYWGMLMVPIVLARKLYVSRKTSAEDIMKRGFQPPGRASASMLSAVLGVEARWLASPPLGTSLMAVARKPT